MGGAWGSCVVGLWGGGGGMFWGNCVVELYGGGGSCRELCIMEPYGGAMRVGGWGYMSVGHAHQSPDGPGIQTPLPPVLSAQRGFLTVPSHQLSPSCPCSLFPPTAATR